MPRLSRAPLSFSPRLCQWLPSRGLLAAAPSAPAAPTPLPTLQSWSPLSTHPLGLNVPPPQVSQELDLPRHVVKLKVGTALEGWGVPQAPLGCLGFLTKALDPVTGDWEGAKRVTLGEMEVPVAWLERGTKAPSSPSPSCFGSWSCHPGEWWSGVQRSWGEVFSDTPRGPMRGKRGWKDLPWGPDIPGAAGAAPWQRLCSHPLGTVHLRVGQAESQAVGMAGREV